MTEIFKTVLFLSGAGSCIAIFLIALKPFAVKKLPAVWQCVVWICAEAFLVLPLWKLFPRPAVSNITLKFGGITGRQPFGTTVIPANAPGAETDFFALLTYIWIAGMCVYFALAAISYIRFLTGMRKCSFEIAESKVFSAVRKELNIRRKIRVRVYSGITSPMLAGIVFPVVYLPESFSDCETERFVCLHELVHYKHRDLLFKWFSLFVNGIHWFNPLVYILSENLGDAFEILCDRAVTKNMNDDEQKRYMNAILDLMERKRNDV